MRAALFGVIAILLLGGSAQAQLYSPPIYHGNDTGGIIPWSCENEAMAQQIAAAYCARWDKYHRITSVHRQYGDFIAFACLWSPHINRYALPAVATRVDLLTTRGRWCGRSTDRGQRRVTSQVAASPTSRRGGRAPRARPRPACLRRPRTAPDGFSRHS